MGKHIGTAKSFRFSEEEIELLDRLALRHGGQKAALVAGMRALDSKAPLTQADVVDWIKRNTKGKG